MGRPKLNIDPDKVRQLASFGCTTREIASFFNCSEDTISGRFSAQVDKGKSEGKIRLRMIQWKQAETSYTMAIFLGKNILGQSDKQEIGMELSGDTKHDVSITIHHALTN